MTKGDADGDEVLWQSEGTTWDERPRGYSTIGAMWLADHGYPDWENPLLHWEK